MRLKLLSRWDALLASYWFIPSVMALSAAALAIGMVRLDTGLELQGMDLNFITLNQPDGARALLSTVAGSMITVAGVSFSITMVVLSLTSSQFGPRLLSNFMRDRSNQLVLGTFVATFIYCLLVLRTVRAADESGAPAFVPHLSVSLGVVLAGLSLGVFIYFIHHTAESIQAASIIAHVAEDLKRLIGKLCADAQTPAEGEVRGLRAASLPADGDARVVGATRSGYVQAVDHKGLVGFAEEHGVLLKVPHGPGAWLVEASPLALVWPPDTPLEEEALKKLHGHFELGPRRTPVQDFDFLFDQLTEVALRALSPGVNDPVTATMCVDRIAQGLHLLASSRLPSAYHFGEAGELRLVTPKIDLEELVANTFGPLRRFSGDNMMVSLHLLHTVGTLRRLTDHAELHRALLREAHLIRETARPVLIKEDFETLTRLYREVTGVSPSAPT